MLLPRDYSYASDRGKLLVGWVRTHVLPAAADYIDGDDRIILDWFSQQLLYDADGSGPIDAVHFADLPGGSVPNAIDFFVI
jgi:hypothetical protein